MLALATGGVREHDRSGAHYVRCRSVDVVVLGGLEITRHLPRRRGGASLLERRSRPEPPGPWVEAAAGGGGTGHHRAA
jgi:hypothetical protein